MQDWISFVLRFYNHEYFISYLTSTPLRSWKPVFRTLKISSKCSIRCFSLTSWFDTSPLQAPLQHHGFYTTLLCVSISAHKDICTNGEIFVSSQLNWLHPQSMYLSQLLTSLICLVLWSLVTIYFCLKKLFKCLCIWNIFIIFLTENAHMFSSYNKSHKLFLLQLKPTG